MVRRVVLVLALSPCGCLAEYVLPGDAATSEASSTGGGSSGGESPTGGEASDAGDEASGGDETGAQPCDAGLLRCGEACVDPDSDEAHCGECGEYCKEAERCIAGECSDVVVLECASCPCPDQCPEKDQGLFEATGGESVGESASAGDTADTADSGGDDGGGEDPQKHLCCAVEAASQVWCVIGDPEDPLVCP